MDPSVIDSILARLSALEAIVMPTESLASRVSALESGALVTTGSTELVATACDQAYEKVMAELSESVFPELNRLAQMVHYTTQDSDGMVDDYRREVVARSDAQLLLTDGDKSKCVIGPHVRVFLD